MALVLIFIAALAAFLQWRFIFQSHLLVSIFIPAAALVTIVLNNMSLDTLDTAMRHSLGAVTLESTLVYSEVE